MPKGLEDLETLSNISSQTWWTQARTAANDTGSLVFRDDVISDGAG